MKSLVILLFFVIALAVFNNGAKAQAQDYSSNKKGSTFNFNSHTKTMNSGLMSADTVFKTKRELDNKQMGDLEETQKRKYKRYIIHTMFDTPNGKNKNDRYSIHTMFNLHIDKQKDDRYTVHTIFDPPPKTN